MLEVRLFWIVFSSILCENHPLLVSLNCFYTLIMERKQSCRPVGSKNKTMRNTTSSLGLTPIQLRHKASLTDLVADTENVLDDDVA